jgi:hypothetical protein
MSGALHYYTDLTYAMWNWLDSERFALLRSSTESRGYRWYALLTPFEVPEVAKNLPGDWRAIDRTGDVVLWELPPALPDRIRPLRRASSRRRSGNPAPRRGRYHRWAADARVRRLGHGANGREAKRSFG